MAERAKFIVLKQQQETEATIIKAEADAEAAKMISDAISKFGPGLVAMRKIEAAQYMVEKLQANPNISYLQGGSTMNMLNLNAQR
jgi:prohibitin 1